MKTEWYAPLAAAFCLMLAYGSSVQPDGEGRDATLARQVERVEPKKSPGPSGFCKASQILGRGVHNPQGEKLGEIRDVVFDPEKTSSVLYVVMSFGGFLGVGEKLFAIPWQELGLAEDGKSFLLGVPRAAFERAPGFDEKSDWPLLADNR
jgi:sporulation protein YlmC with PRC-barrel domain